MMAINWMYGVATLAVAVIVYIYIGQAAPGLPPGLAGDFSLLVWIKLSCLSCVG